MTEKTDWEKWKETPRKHKALIFSLTFTITPLLTHGCMWALEWSRKITEDFPFNLNGLINNFWFSLIVFIIFGVISLILIFSIRKDYQREGKE